MAIVAEHVYLGHNNTIDRVLKADDVAQDLTTVTKITVSFDDTLIESEDNESGVITWAVSGYDTGEIRMALGGEALTAGSYLVPIITYDASNTDGIVWDTILIIVHAEVEAE